MRHSQLRSFHMVAKLGSFTKAAQALNITQPTITAQIRELESQYNVKLFHRRRNNNRLTQSGQQIYQQTLIMFTLEDRIKKVLQNQGAMLSGTLSLGAVSPNSVMPIVEKIHALYPDLELKIRTGGSDDIAKGVADGDLDAAILAYREPDEGLVCKKVTSQPVVLSVPIEHSLASHTSISIAELSRWPVVHRGKGSTTRQILEAAFKERGLTITSKLEVCSREGVREASIHGIGISYVGLHEFQPHPQIKMVEINDLEARSNSYLIYSKDLEELPSIKLINSIITQLY